MVIYILTKFGADWLIFVDASVNKKIVDRRTSDGRTDGHRRTVSDHNSSLSTPCSGELKNNIDLISLRSSKLFAFGQFIEYHNSFGC